MEEIGKDTGHKASVSMPSLDATDFPVPTTTSSASNADQTPCEFTSAESSVVPDPLASASDIITSDSVSFSSIDTASIETTQSVEVGSAEDNSDAVVQQEEALDTQVEEDPSIAIDQFIKKIADEQLSSKRIGSQDIDNNDGDKGLDTNEKENSEGSQKDTDSSEQIPVLVSETNELEANFSLSETITAEDTLNENTNLDTEASNEKVSETVSSKNLGVSESKEAESMEVDSETQKQSAEMTQKKDSTILSDVEFMQTESIEEIQKEIDKMPPKKNSENTQNGKFDESVTSEPPEENVEQILNDGLGEKPDEPVSTDSYSEQDTSGVARDQVLIEKAQEEIKKLDVLVCGECHNSFIYIEEFSEHKDGKCSKKSAITAACDNDGKPQVWGYVLWKTKQTKDLGENALSAWTLYQKWCKLPDDNKTAWITAGQSIQYATKIANAKVTEIKGRQNKQVMVQKVDEPPRPLPIEFVDSNKENSDDLEEDSSPSKFVKKSINVPVKLNNDVTILPSNKVGSGGSDRTNTAIRTTKVLSTQKQEYVVEKIVAKRFNPRRKTWEYNIKWENFPSESNTWEPVTNLTHCKKMLDQFEEQLKRVKEEKAKQLQTTPKGRGRPPTKYKTTPAQQYVPIAPKMSIAPKISNVVGGVSDDYGGESSSGRPQRSSKQKALNQVKAWCGNISDDDSTGVKRRHEDDSDEDYDDKRIKLEEDSEESDKEVTKPKMTIKKEYFPVPKTPAVTVKNGSTGTTQQILPSNILIPDANGVVRINQKQLPALSSGVYIMSKTAGIIKLDSSTSKVATSGGQTIVKVAPKIGQTQIKIVKKDGNTTKQIIQVSPKTSVSSTPVKVTPVKVTSQQKVTPRVRKISSSGESVAKVLKKLAETTSTTVAAAVTKVQGEPDKQRVEDESDDGLEPLPFPSEDEPLPEPESPQGEFLLDPSTGKIAGREYVDKPVVIKEEPAPAPPTTNELENIVKLAAADITEEDLEGDIQNESDPLALEIKESHPSPILHSIKSDPNTSGIRRVVKYTTGQGITEGSILNKALTQGNQRAIISPLKTSTPQRGRVVQQKILNSSIGQRTPQPKPVVRHVIAPQTGHGNVGRPRAVAPKPRFNLTPQKPLPSPLQPTRTYSTLGGPRQAAAATNKVQVYSTKSVSAPIGAGPRKIGGTTVVRSGGPASAVQKTPQYAQRQQPATRIVQRVVTTTRKSDGTIISTRTSPAKVVQNVLSKPKAVISMPSLTDDDSAVGTLTKTQKVLSPKKAVSTPVAVVKQEIQTPVVTAQETASAETPVAQAEAVTDWSSFTMADGDNPIYITGDDGTIYQVAGQNEQGQTILITQGPDGQQQCLLVTNEIGEVQPVEEAAGTSEANPGSVLGISEEAPLMASPTEQPVPVSIATAVTQDNASNIVHAPLHIKTDSTEDTMEGIEEGMQDQVVAQVVRAEPPSPGGTHKVVVMLPDGNLMMTQVSPEEYASLELE